MPHDVKNDSYKIGGISEACITGVKSGCEPDTQTDDIQLYNYEKTDYRIITNGIRYMIVVRQRLPMCGGAYPLLPSDNVWIWFK